MRTHVDFICEEDYLWHPAELPYGEGEAKQRNLSYDEEDGSASLRVDFVTDFRRPAGTHAADTEWYVLAGELRVGGHLLGEGGYVHVAKGAWTPPLAASVGTRILLFRDYGDWQFEPGNAAGATEGADIILLDSAALPWGDVPGKPGLGVKMLYRPGGSGIVTCLARRLSGWADPRFAHHLTFEEGFYLSGAQSYNYGRLRPGAYFYRPPRVLYGDYAMPGGDPPCVVLLRWLGENQPSLYTANPRVVLEGDPENYEPEVDGPVAAGMPLRSRSAGEWDGIGA